MRLHRRLIEEINLSAMEKLPQEEVHAEIQSSWCCLDAVTQRPARLARDVVERFLPPRS